MKPTDNKIRGLRRALGVILGVAAAGAHAQVPPNRPDAGQILDTIKEPAQAPRRSPSFDVQQEVRPALGAGSGFKVNVKSFRFSGNSAFPDAELLPLVRELAGKELDLAALDQAAATVSNYYRARGYFVARAYLPAQEIKDGIVEIAVIEGRVGTVSVKRAPGMRLQETKAREVLANAAVPGQPITEQNIERGLLLLNDLPGVDVKATLVPGASPGTSDLVIDATEGPLLSGSLDIDNFGNRYSGRTRAGGSASINNPLGIGDQFNFRGMTTGAGMDYMRGSYIAPIGGYGTKIGLAYSEMNYKLGGDFTVLKPKGKADIASIFGLHPFVRTRNFSLFGSVGFDQKKIRDETIGSLSNKRLDVTNAGLSGTSRDGFGGGGLMSYGASLALGRLDITGDNAARTIDVNTLATNGGYQKIGFNASRVQRVSDQFSLYGAFSGQSASKNLDSSEKFILGGLGVRAYPQGEAPGDEGYLVNLEGRYEVPWGSDWGNLQLVGFADTGHVTLHKTTYAGWNAGSPNLPNSYSLSGLGIGLNLNKASRYSMRASYAWKLGSNPGRDANNRDADNTNDRGRFWLQAVTWF